METTIKENAKILRKCMNNYYLHIGLEKCASTYLRECVFKQWGNIFVLRDPKKYKYNMIFQPSEKNNIISCEALWRNPEIVEGFSKGFNAKILMVIRNQDDYKKAYYIQKISQGEIEEPYKNIKKCVEYYKDIYRDRILVIELDYMKEFLQSTVDRIADFFGLPKIVAPDIVLNKTVESLYKVRLLEIIKGSNFLCRKVGPIIKNLPEMGKQF